MTLVRRGRLGEAEAVLFELLARRPDDDDANIALGNLRMARADLPTAEAAFSRARDDRSTRAAALYGLGRSALRRGDLAAAEAQFRLLGALSPATPYATYGLAIVAARRGEPDEACAQLALAGVRGLRDVRGVDRDREAAPLRAAPCYPALRAAWIAGRAGAPS